MSSEAQLLYENIGEYVDDDNKIVTCKWLSLTHSININAAKRALHAFVEHQRKAGGGNGINVTYFVAGLGKSKDGGLMHKCAIVPESELEDVKGSLSALTSCHIFSVQKAKLKDYTPLYMTDYEIVKNNLENCNSFSSIKCPWVSLKSAKAAPRVIQQVVVKPENKENAPSKKPDSSKDSKTSAANNPAKKAEPKGSIASMFASANKKGDQSAKPVQKTEAPASKAKSPQKKSGVMAYFGKDRESPSKKKSNTTSKKPESKVVQKEKQEPKGKKKQTADSEDEAPDNKRRKRIRTDLFDSSDEEDAEASGTEDHPEDEEEPEESTVSDKEEEKDEAKASEEKKVEEEKESVTISSNDSAASGKKRKRTKKVVTKHYQDDEGFMVTKKETVWESETDDEDETTSNQEPVKKKIATESMGKPAARNTGAKPESKGRGVAKKNVSPQKSKQTSLMSFFKKK